jgi:dephospho-CoA kinase
VIRVALTGGIATGKSHVLARVAASGAPTIDADVLARAVLEPGTPGAAAVVQRFGPDLLLPDGQIDRRALGRLIFASPEARTDLEAIVHPAVYAAIHRWFDALPTETVFAMADIPLLFETGREGEFDVVVVTACEPEAQVRRIVSRDGLSEAEARQRVAAQLPIAEKVRRADRVIRTDGSRAETDAQVDALVAAFSP